MIATHLEKLGDFLSEPAPLRSLEAFLADVARDDRAGPTPPRTLAAATETIRLVGVFRDEVAHGGFHEFLAGPSGDSATETVHALWKIKASLSQELLERALALFHGNPFIASREARLKQLALIDRDEPGCLGVLDELFRLHVGPHSRRPLEDLDAHLRVFLRLHRDEPLIAPQETTPR